MKSTATAIIIAGIVIGSAIMLTNSDKRNSPQAQNPSQQDDDSNPPANNITIIDGKQIIEIHAKGGYTPRLSVAGANIPTILRFNTAGTFDCSSSVRIPSLGISKALPSSGNTDIDLGTPQAGLLQGSCGMGMYPFEIDFH